MEERPTGEAENEPTAEDRSVMEKGAPRQFAVRRLIPESGARPEIEEDVDLVNNIFSEDGVEVMCGRPPRRKSFSALMTSVGCIHVFGLFAQHRMAAGPDEVRRLAP